jgi:hypothetical protein
MKNPDRKTVSQLVALPNIGKAMAADLQLIGIDHPKKLIGKDRNGQARNDQAPIFNSCLNEIYRVNQWHLS